MTATPVYPPFLSAPRLSGRDLIRVPLRLSEGCWRWDFAALELLEREGWRVDAMISDISMPRLNGLALVARVRAGLPQLPIILMSGFEPVAVDADAVVPPDVVRLQKPFPLEVLLPLLHDLRGSAVP